MDLIPHPIAASNVLFGVSNFFVLPLPPAWELLRGPFEPEVERQARREEISWVLDGRAMYLLVHRGRRATVECHIHIAPQRLPLKVPSGTGNWRQGRLDIGGHPAAYVLGSQLRGWWPRQRVVTLRTALYCEVVGRGIGVELLGEGGEEGHLQELLRALSQLQCH